MQEKEQIKSPIKQRILLFVAELGISKREFYALTGISRGTLDNDTGINEETLTKFLATYPDINLEWLIHGVGTKYKSKLIKQQASFEQDITHNSVEECPPLPYLEKSEMTKSRLASDIDKDSIIAYLDKKDQVIIELSKEVGRLKERLKD